MFEKNPCKYFGSIPVKFITQHMCDVVLDIDLEHCFLLVPDNFKTQKICDKIFRLNPIGFIGRIPVVFRTKEMYLEIFKLYSRLLDFIHFPKNVMTQELCDELFSIDPFKAMDYIPNEFVTDKMRKMLFKLNPVKAIMLFEPSEIKKFEYYMYAINIVDNEQQLKQVLSRIPKKFHNQEMFNIIFSKGKEKYFKYIPDEFRTEEMYKDMLKIDDYTYSKLIHDSSYNDSIFEVTAI